MKGVVFLVLISLAVGFPLSDKNFDDASSRWSLYFYFLYSFCDLRINMLWEFMF